MGIGFGDLAEPLLEVGDVLGHREGRQLDRLAEAGRVGEGD
jgi:hypothetical protein